MKPREKIRGNSPTTTNKMFRIRDDQSEKEHSKTGNGNTRPILETTIKGSLTVHANHILESDQWKQEPLHRK